MNCMRCGKGNEEEPGAGSAGAQVEPRGESRPGNRMRTIAYRALRIGTPVVLVLGGVLALIFFLLARPGMRRATCLSNVRQLALAIAMYA